jgi:integrase
MPPPSRLRRGFLYDHHLRPYLASVALREISPEVIGRWQADRLAERAGPVSVRHAMDLLGAILEHAFVAGRIPANPVRRVKKARRPRREEVQALSPATIEAMRAAASTRDAALISVLAYAGLRPGEALGLRWGDIRERTILIQRSVSLGEEADTKTRQHRTVRLLAHSPRICARGAWPPVVQTTTGSCSPARKASRGRKPRISHGVGERSGARSRPLAWLTPGPTNMPMSSLCRSGLGSPADWADRGVGVGIVPVALAIVVLLVL